MSSKSFFPHFQNYIQVIESLSKYVHLRPMDIMYIVDIPDLNHDYVDICKEDESLQSFVTRVSESVLTSRDFLDLMGYASDAPKTNHYQSLREGLVEMLSAKDITESLKPELRK